jgi:hypothetical protein
MRPSGVYLNFPSHDMLIVKMRYPQQLQHNEEDLMRGGTDRICQRASTKIALVK